MQYQESGFARLGPHRTLSQPNQYTTAPGDAERDRELLRRVFTQTVFGCYL